jgi:hypothetical protein
MTIALLGCMAFGIWLYVYEVRELARAERSGVFARAREGDRQRFLRAFWARILIAAIALAMAAFALIVAASDLKAGS